MIIFFFFFFFFFFFLTGYAGWILFKRTTPASTQALRLALLSKKVKITSFCFVRSFFFFFSVFFSFSAAASHTCLDLTSVRWR
jgi:hypothetical protein